MDIDLVLAYRCLGWGLRSEAGARRLNEGEPDIHLLLFRSPSQGLNCSPLKTLPGPSSKLGQRIGVSYHPSMSRAIFTPWLLSPLYPPPPPPHPAPSAASPPALWQGTGAIVSTSRQTKAHPTSRTGMQISFQHGLTSCSLVVHQDYIPFCSAIFTFLRLPSHTPGSSNSLTLASFSIFLVPRQSAVGMINVWGPEQSYIAIRGGANQLQIQSFWNSYRSSKHGIKEVIALN